MTAIHFDTANQPSTRDGLIVLLNRMDNARDCACAFARVMTQRAQSQVGLTTRQHQVLDQLVDGRSNKEIARSLNLSEPTIKIHLAAVMAALGARNRTEAAVKGALLGYGPHPLIAA
ncbi:MAG: LuxR C-terminal-related transcriptional regulator [Rhodospirillales bacterium]